MKRYGDLGHNSEVAGYEIAADQLTLQFKDGSTQIFSDLKAGKIHVDRMKDLARLGKGLNTYLNRHVKQLHD